VAEAGPKTSNLSKSRSIRNGGGFISCVLWNLTYLALTGSARVWSNHSRESVYSIGVVRTVKLRPSVDVKTCIPSSGANALPLNLTRLYVAPRSICT